MKAKSARPWGDRGGNLGTFSLKMGKTLHPTPHTLPPPKNFLPQTLVR
ncbi:MAG: hypothetical protein IM473_07475 [Microcystis sp. M015S2]|nr:MULTISPECIES: hypothetical protein [unclassified Microcystis]MCA2708778.1 hypothetical protein [Microcystis sp. M025S2]MCA2742259.1 hypothetical protein [Microcystis sp. M015S2]MCA2759471.1 hypothetical protein [Microcystis sp. M145S2]